jgi:hypothetical protein
MVSHKHKCIFVHIPKTAGTSIENILSDRPNGEISLPRISSVTNYREFTGWDNVNMYWLQHATMQQIHDDYIGDFRGYFKFAIVRNPWERTISDYIWIQKTMNISGSVKSYLLLTDAFSILKIRDERYYRLDHTIPQYNFLFDTDNNQLVDFIGRFENLQEDFNIVCDKIGIPQQQLAYTKKQRDSTGRYTTISNESRKYVQKHYTEFYDEETNQIVAEKYAKDIEMFGYKFGE